MLKRLVSLALAATALAILLIPAIPTAANQFGRTEATRKNGTGCGGPGCHGSGPSQSVQVIILGPDTVVVDGSAVYSVTISGGPERDGGTNIAVSRGSLDRVDNVLKKFQGELTHENPTPFPQAGTLTFRFRYTAPLVPGIDTIFANGNSVNGDRQPTGDAWNFAPEKRVIIVPTVTSVSSASSQAPASFTVSQNYPNPFNPSTRIVYSLPLSTHVVVEVFDLSGTKIATLVDDVRSPGRHETQFVATPSLASGIYVYTVTAGTFVGRKTMTFVK